MPSTPPATPTFTHKEFYEVVQAGKCGIGRVGAWNVGPWAKSAIAEDYAVIPYPPLKAGQKGYQVSWSNAIALNGASKAEDASYAVFKALLGKAGQTVFYEKLTSDHPIDLTRYQVANCYMGRIGLINSGGESKGDGDLAQAIRTAVINKRAGGMGLIVGRKSFSRPMDEGAALIRAIQDVYLDPEVTVA